MNPIANVEAYFSFVIVQTALLILYVDPTVGG